MASKTSVSGMLLVFFSIFLMTLMPGCILTPSTQNVTSTSPLVCNPPYIQVGTGCCLDNNSNNICDRDEGVTTVSVTSTSAAATSTTSTSPTSPTSTSISPVAQKITSKKIMLSGDLRADVDVVFTPDRKKALMSTRVLAGQGHMDI
ncbi:MAG: hypothetical protein KAU03_02170, partial [Candidatus Altiarchaeales archaeon]|nr:hypothetical protein [Candidatus Altiarchaeales archaeon]